MEESVVDILVENNYSFRLSCEIGFGLVSYYGIRVVTNGWFANIVIMWRTINSYTMSFPYLLSSLPWGHFVIMKLSIFGPLGSTYCLKYQHLSASLSYCKDYVCSSIPNSTFYQMPIECPLGIAQRCTRISGSGFQSYIGSCWLLIALAARGRHAFGSWHPTHQVDEIPVFWLHPSRTRRSPKRVAEDLASEYRCTFFPKFLSRWMNHSF